MSFENYFMSKGDSKYVAKIFLYNKGRVLLLQKENNKWHLPGGHVKTTETPSEGLVREVREETDLKTFTHRLYRKLNTLYLYKGKTNQTKIALSNEHINYKWIPVIDVVKYDLTEDTKGYIKYI